MLSKMKVISFITAVAVLFCTFEVNAHPVNVDIYLLNAGFPESFINEMSIPQKEYIYENSKGKNITFCGYDQKEFSFENKEEFTASNNSSTRSGLIEESHITIEVFGVKYTSSSGQVWYAVYPSFKWNIVTDVNNDSFAMSMYPGWEAIPQEENFRLHLLNGQGQSAQYVDLGPSSASSSGYGYQIPGGTGKVPGWYEGYASFDIEKTSASASPYISLYYAHDTSGDYSVSYNINVGVFGITLTGNTEEIDIKTGNYVVEGLKL